MGNFKIGKYEVITSSKDTRSGFNHYATLYDSDGKELMTSKAVYYNRTWERFRYESVIKDVFHKANKKKFISDEDYTESLLIISKIE